MSYNWGGYFDTVIGMGYLSWNALVKIDPIFKYLRTLENNKTIVTESLQLSENVVRKLGSPLLNLLIAAFNNSEKFHPVVYVIMQSIPGKREGLDALEFLLDKGYTVNNIPLFFKGKKNRDFPDKNQALKWAVKTANLEIVKLLVERGADVQADENYALKWAILYEHCEIIKYLLNNGANIFARNGELVFLIKQNAKISHLFDEYGDNILNIFNEPLNEDEFSSCAFKPL